MATFLFIMIVLALLALVVTLFSGGGGVMRCFTIS